MRTETAISTSFNFYTKNPNSNFSVPQKGRFLGISRNTTTIVDLKPFLKKTHFLSVSMSSGSKKPPFSRQCSYNSLYMNPLVVEPKHHGRSCSDGVGVAAAIVPLGDCLNLHRTPLASADQNKDNNNVVNLGTTCDKENAVPASGSLATAKKFATLKSMSTGRALKPTSLEYCMQVNDPKLPFGSKTWDVSVGSEKSNSVNVWDYSDSEAAPASSWATLPNRALLCRPLPLDVGRCTCVIVKEATPKGLDGGALYSLYTNEGKGRQDRKLAVAHHRQRNGRSEFTIAQTTKGLFSSSDDSYIGTVTANFMGSKYHIWDQGSNLNSLGRRCKPLLAVVRFMPTIATWTGNYRSMRVYVPKHQSMQLRSTTTQVQHINGLPKDWEEKKDRTHELCSRVPHYNKISKQYELDYRDRGRAGLQIQKSVKNFQLTLEESGKQTILQLGRVEKSKYVMDYRYPLTGYQAFCICLASMDSKLCCTI